MEPLSQNVDSSVQLSLITLLNKSKLFFFCLSPWKPVSFVEFSVSIAMSFNEKAYFTGCADKQIAKIRQMAVGCE